MSEEDVARLRVQLALDGELDAAHQLAFERELQDSPHLAAEYERQLTLRDAIRRHAPREAAPERLRMRIEALGAQPSARPRLRWPTTAIAAGLAVATAVGGYWAGRAGRDPDLAALVAGYQRAALSGHEIDVASSDRHTVKPWLASRSPLGVFAPDLAEAGFALVGGRIDIVDHRPTPTLVYQRRGHYIAVSELPLAPARMAASSVEGYHVVSWSDALRNYLAVSDIDPAELTSFVEAFRRTKES